MRPTPPTYDAPARTLLRWRQYLTVDGGLSGLRQFHDRHRLLLLAHDPESYRALSTLVDEAPVLGLAVIQARYRDRLVRALSQRASRGQHLNVLEYAARGVLDLVSEDERASWTTVLRDYRRDNVPLAVPQGTLRRMLRRVAPRSWAARQTYLDSRPAAARVD